MRWGVACLLPIDELLKDPLVAWLAIRLWRGWWPRRSRPTTTMAEIIATPPVRVSTTTTAATASAAGASARALTATMGGIRLATEGSPIITTAPPAVSVHLLVITLLAAVATLEPIVVIARIFTVPPLAIEAIFVAALTVAAVVVAAVFVAAVFVATVVVAALVGTTLIVAALVVAALVAVVVATII